jgi:hypothetical protein
MAIKFTQSLTEMSTRIFMEGKGRPERKADNLTSICEPTICNMRKPRRLTTIWTSTNYYEDSFTFFYWVAVGTHHYKLRTPVGS